MDFDTKYHPGSPPSRNSPQENTQPYPGQTHFLTGTHITIKAASCKIALLNPQAVTYENRMVECSPHTPGL